MTRNEFDYNKSKEYCEKILYIIKTYPKITQKFIEHPYEASSSLFYANMDDQTRTWDSIVFDKKFNFEYFNNNTVDKNHFVMYDGWDATSNTYWTPEQLEDEGFLFQQSLAFDYHMMFSICCVSWLHAMEISNLYIVCDVSPEDLHIMYQDAVVYNNV